jgi:hypothetical protein
MIKTLFGKTVKTEVVLKYKKIAEEIYVYKLKYNVKGNKINTYGLCHEEDLSSLEEKLLIPRRLSQYKVYHKEILEELKSDGCPFDCAHEISLSQFFNRDESLVPIPADCVILREIKTTIPHTYFSGKMRFFYLYNSDYPVPKVVFVNQYDERKILNPLICEDKYDLEECFKILKNRKDVSFSKKYKIQTVKDGLEYYEDYASILKENDNIGEKKYLEFSWHPKEEDWKTYFQKLENYGLDMANEYLVKYILNLKERS